MILLQRTAASAQRTAAAVASSLHSPRTPCTTIQAREQHSLGVPLCSLHAPLCFDRVNRDPDLLLWVDETGDCVLRFVHPTVRPCAQTFLQNASGRQGILLPYWHRSVAFPTPFIPTCQAHINRCVADCKELDGMCQTLFRHTCTQYRSPRSCEHFPAS